MKFRPGHARRRSLIGLDFGAGGVRTAQLSRSGEQWTVTALGRHEGRDVSDEPIRKDTLPSKPPPPPVPLRLRGDEIRSCLEQGEFRNTDAATALSSPDVEFFALELPDAVLQTGNPDAANVVHYEIERISTTAAKGPVQTSFWRLPRTQVSAPNAIGVAAPADRVEEIIHLSEKHGLWCANVDTSATALSRLGGLLARWEENQVWGMLDLGARQARLILMILDVPVLVRTVGAGGQAWSERIASSLRIGRKAAEVLKREHGIDRTQLGSVLLGILRGDLNELAAEVKRSYEYVLSCYPSRQAADLILTGGGAAMPKLTDFLAELLGIAVRRAGTLLDESSCRLSFGMEVALRDQALETGAVAIGLAIEE